MRRGARFALSTSPQSITTASASVCEDHSVGTRPTPASMQFAPKTSRNTARIQEHSHAAAPRMIEIRPHNLSVDLTRLGLTAGE